MTLVMQYHTIIGRYETNREVHCIQLASNHSSNHL